MLSQLPIMDVTLREYNEAQSPPPPTLTPVFDKCQTFLSIHFINTLVKFCFLMLLVFFVWHIHMSYFWGTGTPVLDFWWRLLLVLKSEWVLPYLHCGDKCNVHSLRSTSCASCCQPLDDSKVDKNAHFLKMMATYSLFQINKKTNIELLGLFRKRKKPLKLGISPTSPVCD